MILGHAHPEVLSQVKRTMAKGTSFGIPTELETRLATMIVEAIDSVEKVRLVSSGTEAVMTAIRLARGYTGRDEVIKFVGCYHGHVDHMLVQAGSGAMTFGTPSSPGVPKDFTKHTILLPYNNPEMVERAFKKHAGKIAAVIVEPITGNMGVVPPKPGFLETLRKMCTKHGSILIFDEVITGFRLNYGTVQDIFGVKADLTCLGKIIGGGFPIGACGGRARIMDNLAPQGEIRHHEICKVFHHDVKGRHLLAAFAIRGLFSFHRAHRKTHSRHDRRPSKAHFLVVLQDVSYTNSALEAAGFFLAFFLAASSDSGKL
jgi:glutamate-1-semialdehyde 2,1-aminomutase